jgi:uncharacterized protein (DUF433 family)
MVTNSRELDWSGCSLIQRDPQKMGGVPNVDGMRITPEAVLANYEDGLSISEIIEQFPSLNEQQIHTILTYAEERGRLTRPAA